MTSDRRVCDPQRAKINTGLLRLTEPQPAYSDTADRPDFGALPSGRIKLRNIRG